MGIHILGTGSYLPETVVENEAFSAIVDTSDEWIVKHSGIHRRHFQNGPTYEMAVKAGTAALEAASLTPDQIDLILCTTVSGDYDTPAMACVVQGLLGAKNAVAFDINAACAGFVYGLDLANLYLQHGYRRILLISAEQLSRITDFTDRSTCVLFGDGAGAVVLEGDDSPFVSALGADGAGVNALFARKPDNSNPFLKEQRTLSEADGFPEGKPGMIHMAGQAVYKFAVTAMPAAVRKACEKANLAPEALDWIIPHQANLRIIQTAISALKLPEEKFICNIGESANISSACIPVALDQAVRDGRIRRGQTVCAVGFGAGLVYGSAIFKY